MCTNAIRKKTVMVSLGVFILRCSVPGTSIQVYANSDETVKSSSLKII